MEITYEDYIIIQDNFAFNLFVKKSKYPVGHYSKLSSAIKKIAFLRMAKDKDSVSLKEYIDRYEKIVNSLLDGIKIDSK